ncbi:MAG: DNA primase [Candidatus Gastranaerophilales bacterium]|nr:DNA primase [Candidatus Gastranaerophilales bacterium]
MITSNNTDIIEEIKSRLDILEVISEHIVLKKSGRNYWGCCPFHNEKTPSFSVNAEKGIFKCFGCGEGGDAISFLMKINNSSFMETMIELAEKFGLPLPMFGQSAEKTEIKKQIYEINKKTTDFYTDMLLNSSEAGKAREYLAKRNISEEIIKEYNLGYSQQSADSLINHLLGKHKISIDALNNAGLVSQKSNGKGYVDRFRNRLMIPIHNEKGDIVAFGARALDEGQNPKYLNSPDTPAYNKSRILYGLYQAKDFIKENDAVIIMEGYFDVITAHINGIKNVVASSGTALTDQHIKLLARYTDSRRIYLAFDMDLAGQNATNRNAEVIKTTFEGLGQIKQFDENFASLKTINDRSACEIRVVTIGSGKDPDEYIRTEGAEKYKNLIEKSPLLIDYQINRIMNTKDEIISPQDKAKLVQGVIPILSEIKNSIIKNEYVKLVAERLKIDEESLSKEVNRLQNDYTLMPMVNQPIVKKSSKKDVLAQKNLLGLYFIEGENFSCIEIKEYLKEVRFTEKIFVRIKEEIEKIIKEADNIKDLAKILLNKMADEEEIKKTISDIIFSLDDKKCLNSDMLKLYIRENIACIEQSLRLEQQSELQSQYKEANSDELSSLQLQYKVREQIKQKYNRRLETTK